MIDRCAGIDVGQALLVVCVRVVDGSRLVEEVRSFGATTRELVALRDWLVGLGVTQVAMESTGVYWKAPYYMLEDEFEVLLVNAAHLKHVTPSPTSQSRNATRSGVVAPNERTSSTNREPSTTRTRTTHSA